MMLAEFQAASRPGTDTVPSPVRGRAELMNEASHLIGAGMRAKVPEIKRWIDEDEDEDEEEYTYGR